jgi:hypothetical protein
MLKVQSDRLDYEYLHHWATQLNVADLLEHALSEAGLHRGYDTEEPA